MTNQTRNLLRCFGLEMFLVSFETLGEAIDIARESLLEPGYHRDYYSILGDRYGVSRKRSMMTFGEQSLLRGVFIGISWRRLLVRFMNGPLHLVDLFMLRLTI